MKDSIVPTTCVANYSIVRTYRVTDACGNQASCTQTITVNNTVPPVVPASQTSVVACPADAVAPVPPSVTDACGSPIVPTLTIGADPVCEGNKTYTFTYTDCSGLSSVWTYAYTVERVPFTLPANVGSTVSCSDSTDIVPALPLVKDACGNVLSPSAPVVSAKPGCTGTRTYTYTYTDCEGNTGQWVFTYTVNDNVRPVVTGVLPPVTVSGCSVSDAPAAVTTIAGLEALGLNISDACASDDRLSLTNVQTSSGSCPIVLTRTYRITDPCGNFTDISQTISIRDTTRPVISCPSAQTFCVTTVGSYVVNALSASDNCGGAATISYQITGATTRSGTGGNASGSFNLGTSVIRWVVSDPCGNTNECSTTITILPLLTSSQAVSVCANKLPYLWKGNTITAAGTFIDTLSSTTGGCDTIATLTLTVTPLLTSTTSVSVCANKLPYLWKGNTITAAGTFTDTLTSTTGGCDTIATLTLTVTPLLTSTTSVSVCANKLPYLWKGNTITAAGTFIDTLTSTTGGCDTIATLTLTVTPLLTSTTSVSVCANKLPYLWKGNTITGAGTFIDTLTSTTGGCDTIATLTLTVTPLLTSSQAVSVCANKLPYLWKGNTITAAGTFTDTLTSTSGGCDTIATLTLTVTPLLTSATSVSVCANKLPYLWKGNT
ncbi:MAG: hypothetical protein ACK5VH_10555, partial [bacterium]